MTDAQDLPATVLDIVECLAERIGHPHSHYISPDIQMLMDAKAEIERLRRSLRAERNAVLEEAAKAAGSASWMHAGDDAYSQDMDAGARHQVQACVKAIRALKENT